MAVSTIFAELLIVLQPNLIGWYIIVSWSVLCKKQQQMIVFKIKITGRVQNFIEFLCISYLLHHWSLGNQRKCADLLFVINELSTVKWAYTDSSTLTSTITRHTTGLDGDGGGFHHAR